MINLKKVKKLIFVDMHATTRAPMASEIFRYNLYTDENINRDFKILSRGVVVNFSEPMNQKAEAVLAGNDIYYKEYQSKEFTPEEVDEYTLVLAMDSDVRDILLEKYSELNEDNTFVLAFFVGEELETMDPYGEPIVKYGLCFEALKEITRNLLLKLENGDSNE